MPNTTTPGTAKTQLDKFKEAAKEVETDDSEETFDRRLKQVAKAPQPKPAKRD